MRFIYLYNIDTFFMVLYIFIPSGGITLRIPVTKRIAPLRGSIFTLRTHYAPVRENRRRFEDLNFTFISASSVKIKSVKVQLLIF